MGMAAVEHEQKLNFGYFADRDFANAAELLVIGYSIALSLLRFNHLDLYAREVRMHRTSPSPRPKEANRRQLISRCAKPLACPDRVEYVDILFQFERVWADRVQRLWRNGSDVLVHVVATDIIEIGRGWSDAAGRVSRAR